MSLSIQFELRGACAIALYFLMANPLANGSFSLDTLSNPITVRVALESPAALEEVRTILRRAQLCGGAMEASADALLQSLENKARNVWIGDMLPPQPDVPAAGAG